MARVNGHKFAICLIVTSLPSALSSSSESALPPPGSSAWKAGQSAAVNVPAGANSVLSSLSFSQIFSGLQAHSLETTADSGASTTGPEALGGTDATVKADTQVLASIPGGNGGFASLAKAFVSEPGNQAKPAGSGDFLPLELPDSGLAELGKAQPGQGQSGVPRSGGNAAVQAAPLVPIPSSSGAKAPKQGETVKHTQLTAPLSVLPGQASMNLAATAPSNTALLTHAMENQPVPRDGAVDEAKAKAEAGITISRAQLAVPAAQLAFALRLKSIPGGTTGDEADRSNEQDAGSRIGASARALLPAAGARMLDAVMNASDGVLSDTSNEVSNSRANAGWAQGSSASPFATQLKALTDGLSGQGRVASTSEMSVPSGTSSESRDSAGSGSSDTGANSSFANAGLVNTGLPKAASGGSVSTPPVPAVGALRSGGLLDSGQFPGAQVLTANSSAPPSTSAATAATATAGSLPENEISLAGGPVRNIRVQLSGEGNQHVDMRLVERGGTLSVSVRSTDETLTRSLQENLPELNTRLTGQHFQTETWLPGRGVSTDSGGSGGSGTGSGSDSGTGSNGSGASKHGSSSSDGRSDSQSHSRQSQDGRPDRRPAWVRQLAAFDGVPQMTPGQGMKN